MYSRGAGNCVLAGKSAVFSSSKTPETSSTTLTRMELPFGGDGEARPISVSVGASVASFETGCLRAWVPRRNPWPAVEARLNGFPALPKRRAAHHQMHLRRTAAEEHRCLPGRIAAAHHHRCTSLRLARAGSGMINGEIKATVAFAARGVGVYACLGALDRALDTARSCRKLSPSGRLILAPQDWFLRSRASSAAKNSASL